MSVHTHPRGLEFLIRWLLKLKAAPVPLPNSHNCAGLNDRSERIASVLIHDTRGKKWVFQVHFVLKLSTYYLITKSSYLPARLLFSLQIK
jgi:hypothetical protein